MLLFLFVSKSYTFFIHPPLSVKLLVRLRRSFIHFCKHKFRHNFYHTLDPLCSCNVEPEIFSVEPETSNYLLCSHNVSSARSAVMNYLNLINPSISQRKLPLQIYFYMVIKWKVHCMIAKICRVLLNIYLQQKDLLNHSSKIHIYCTIYVKQFFYISCIFTTRCMWCANEIYYSA